ncbi:hypothetical protein DID88_008068 [Monilinia fructigena]|uniref:GED domain-containing protein n=1 Tax=Monilinia fructigena TaxID=38457 RepID=A0A395J464_9HELO|nr:hypothetical protein DID88_008068 [Monilinia fructigena]
MGSRITKNQKDEIILTGGRLKTFAHTQVPISPCTFKQEVLHESKTQTSQGAEEYHLSSNPHYHIHLEEYHRAQYHESVSSHPSRNTSKESDSRNTTPSLDSIAGLHIMAQDPQILIEALSELADHDVEHVVDLPRIIVVGDQSVGKSTLITLLSGVDLPKKSGCCTRCPANIVTKAGDTWSCTISLHQKYGYRTPKSPIKDRDVTKNNQFPPWFRQEQVIKEFIKITDKAKLSEAMEWAQIALLNHNQDYEQFIPGKGQRYLDKNPATVAEFTPNFVKVELTAPKLLTLSFFDLPGIISNTPTVDQRYLIKVFENIAKSYIQSLNTLIIFAMTMQVEAVLSRAKSLIEEERATDRCMGVLTKPDIIVEKDGNNDWEKILSGDEHHLGHGWRVTKQPGPESKAGEQGYQIQAGKDEKEFFTTSELWSGKWKKFEKLCGISRIQSKIPRLLAESIGESLPDIKVRIANRKNVIIKELKGLPELPNQNVQLHVARLLRNLSQDFQKIMSSQHNSSDTTLHGEWTKLSRQFHELILHNKPKITLSDPSDILKVEIISLDDDEGDDNHVPVPGGHIQIVPVSESNEKHTHSQIATDKDLAPATPLNSMVELETPISRIPEQKAKPRSNPFTDTIFENHAHYGKGFTTIGKIRRKIENHTYMGLPDMVNAPVYEYFCEKTGDALDALYKLETYSPFTTNQEDIQKRKEDEKSDLKRIRHRVRAIRFVEKEIYCNPKKMKTKPAETDLYLQEKKKIVEQVTPEQLGKDSFQNEIDVAAYIRGYYIVAASRYIGSVCLSINNRLFRYVKENIEDLLENQLGNNNPATGVARCQQLMEENDEVGARRRKLQTELKKTR